MIIGIDFGKHIGLAYAVGSVAVPFCTVNSIKELVGKLKEKRAKQIVIGWPLLLNGQPGEQCNITKNMLDALLKDYPISYKLQDERMSSKFVNTYQQSKYDKVKKQYGPDEHAHSAAWILQIFLDTFKD